MASEDNSKKFYCLQLFEDLSTWKIPLMSLMLNQFNIRTMVDCRPYPSSKNRVFSKKSVRKLCKGTASYVYAKRLANCESIHSNIIDSTFADTNGPILILTCADNNATRPLEVCNALHSTGRTIEMISVHGMKVEACPFVPFTLEEEVSSRVPEAPQIPAFSLPGTCVKIKGERTLGMSSDGSIHSAGLIITRKKDSEVLAIIRTSGTHELAKGRVEENETFAQTALRELREEAGCVNPEVLEIEWRWAYVREYKYKWKKSTLMKKVFWFYAYLPDFVTLEFGEREKKTQAVEWIRCSVMNKSVAVPDALSKIQSAMGIFSVHSEDMGYSDNKMQCRKPPRFSINDTEAYLDYLDEHGFVVIAAVISNDEMAEGKALFWDWMESLGSGIDRNDPHTFIDKNWPSKPRFGSGIIHTCGCGQSDFQWFVRSRPAVRQVFEHIWETKELLTSYDGFAAWRPWQLDQTWKTSPSWFHVDQNPVTNPGRECFQAQVTFTASTHETGGFACIPGSHKMFPEFKEAFEGRDHKLYRLRWKGIKKHRVQKMDRIHVCCEAGDMIIWDSRLMHGSTHSFVKPDLDPHELLRLTSFVCFTPRLPKISKDIISKRCAAVNGYVTTSHLPHEFHAVEDIEESNATRSRHGLKLMELPKRKKKLPEEAYPLMSGYPPGGDSAM